MDAPEFTCDITAAAFNAETGRADITVTLSEAGNVLETYIISMRTDDDSSYSYVIASFAAA